MSANEITGELDRTLDSEIMRMAAALSAAAAEAGEAGYSTPDDRRAIEEHVVAGLSEWRPRRGLRARIESLCRQLGLKVVP